MNEPLPADLRRSDVSQRNARQERRRRARARRKFLPFVRYTMPTFEEGRHHRLMGAACDQVLFGGVDRLIVVAPPRHTKSEFFSRKLGAFALGHHPEWLLIGASHTGDFQRGIGRAVRDLIGNNPRYRALFPEVQLRADSQAANRWNTNQGGGYIGAGVTGTIAGEGAHLLIIDDPIKSRQEANSKARRDSIWQWFTDDALTRLMPGGRIVIVTTRWHSDDLVGRLIRAHQAGGEQWNILYMPATALTPEERETRDPLAKLMDPLGRQPGEALWPEWYNEHALRRVRVTQSILDGPRSWNSLYQGMPTEAQGSYFKRAWFQRYVPGTEPVMLNEYGASDWALTPDGGDWTVHGVAGVDANKDLWLKDQYRAQVDTGAGLTAQREMIRAHPFVTQWAEDKANVEKTIAPLRESIMTDAGESVNFEGYSVAANKAARSASFQGWCSYGKVHVPIGPGYEWGDDFIEECVEFTGNDGDTDDQVDWGSLFGQQLRAQYGPPELTPPAPESPRVLKNLVDELRNRGKENAGGIYRK